MELSIVSTLYNSSNYLEEFCSRIVSSIESLNISEYEIILVNDGSPDESLKIAKSIISENEKVKCIDLSRNFGHHNAIMTGLQYANGRYIFLIDSDLEEEPELLKMFWNEMKSDLNRDVIFGIQRRRKGDLFERFSGSLFYNLFSILGDIDYPHNTSTARLMSRKYVKSVLKFKEKEFEILGIFVLAGFNQKGVLVDKGFKGTSSYTLLMKIGMAVRTITAFSNKPLYMIFLLGLLISFVSLLNLIYVVVIKMIYSEEVVGWSSLMASIWFIGGIIMFSIGIIGIYISKIFLEVKNRPISLINKIYTRDD